MSSSKDLDRVISEGGATSEPVPLSQKDLNVLDRDDIPIAYSTAGGDKYNLSSPHQQPHVGIITLPSGVTVRITPKNLESALYLIRYSSTEQEELPSQATNVSFTQDGIVLHLAERYATELDRLITQHPQKMSDQIESRSRRPDTRKLIRRRHGQSVDPHRKRTSDRDQPRNRVILAGALQFADYVSGHQTDQASKLARELRDLAQQLSSYGIKRPEGLSEDALDKQTEELASMSRVFEGPYAELLRLAQLARSNFGGSLESGNVPAGGYFINLESGFEQAIRDAVSSVLESEWVCEKDRQKDLVEGPSQIEVRPDFIIRESSDSPTDAAVIGDAKWQFRESPRNKDFHKSVTYGAAYDAPSLMIFPKNDGEIEGDYDLSALPTLRIEEITVTASNYQEFVRQFESDIAEMVSDWI